MQLLSLIIPAYNEEKRIGRTIESYLNILSKVRFEIIVVDDGSEDNTLQVVERFSRYNVRAVRLSKNYGKGRAVREGLRSANGDILVFVDSDGSADCEAISNMVEILDSGVDCVIGSRYVQGADAEIKPFRRFASRIFNTIVEALFNLGLSDTQCGFKGFRSEAVLPILPFLRIDRFAFDVELLWYLKLTGAEIVEMPIRWRDQAGSKVTVIKHGLTMVLDLLKLRFRNGCL